MAYHMTMHEELVSTDLETDEILSLCSHSDES